MSPGRRAGQPPRGWKPHDRRDGLKVTFISQDGTEQKEYDFARLPGPLGVSEDLAVAFAAATGPLGTWTRLGAAANLWQSARQASKWVHESRPALTTLADLTAADARLLGLSFRVPSGGGIISSLRALFLASPVVTKEANRALALVRTDREQTQRQPYNDAEYQLITSVARSVVRRARDRLRSNRRLLQEYRAGLLDDLDPRNPRRCLAEVLDHCDTTGDYPRTADGFQAMVTRRAARAADGRPVQSHLHLNAGETWAFGILLAGQTSLNLSTLARLPATHLRATAPAEPGIALVRASKPRRGRRSEMTLPMQSLHSDLHRPPNDQRPHHVLSTSLTTAFGVFSLLVELGEPTRRLLETDRAFVYYSSSAGAPGVLRAGLPQGLGAARTHAVWLRDYLTGNADHDGLLLGISFDRLRKTHLERNRKPVAHTPDMLSRYLRRMKKVNEEGFQIVKEALDDEVQAALKRRRMTRAEDDAQTVDTALGGCTDIEHPPHTPDKRCGLSFWSCLNCGNARAFPRHLPLQMLAIDELDRLRSTISVDRWIGEFAGRRAQLEDIAREYEPAQRDLARTQITDVHRRVVGLLLSGDLDPL